MFEFWMEMVPVIEIAISPIIFAVVYLLTGENDFKKNAFYVAVGMVLFTIWIWAVGFLFDFFKELIKQRNERLMEQREFENWRKER